jgi:AraC-like DNA-binding protein
MPFVGALQTAFANLASHPLCRTCVDYDCGRVRAELAEACHSRPAVAVTTVASRWGFVYLGRFAQQYRQLFGESPSQTLRAVNELAQPRAPDVGRRLAHHGPYLKRAAHVAPSRIRRTPASGRGPSRGHNRC